MHAFAKAYVPVDGGGDDSTQEHTSESTGGTSPQSIIRAAACTHHEARVREKRKCNISMTEVEADAGAKVDCIFLPVGPKRQKCCIPMYPSFNVTFASTDVPGEWLDLTAAASPWFHEALKKIQSSWNPDKKMNVFKTLHDDLKLIINETRDLDKMSDRAGDDMFKRPTLDINIDGVSIKVLNYTKKYVVLLNENPAKVFQKRLRDYCDHYCRYGAQHR